MRPHESNSQPLLEWWWLIQSDKDKQIHLPSQKYTERKLPKRFVGRKCYALKELVQTAACWISICPINSCKQLQQFVITQVIIKSTATFSTKGNPHCIYSLKVPLVQNSRYKRQNFILFENKWALTLKKKHLILKSDLFRDYTFCSL